MTEAKPYKLITSISKLPLDAFIDGFIDNDYSGLVIEGEVPQPLLILAWNDIIEQYNDAISKGDDSQKQYISAYQEYLRAKTRHDLAIKYIELINAYFFEGVWINGELVKGIIVPKWIKDLNKICDIRYTFNKNKQEDLRAYLDRCFNRNKSNLIRYKLAETQLSDLMKVQNLKNEDAPKDRSYFIQIMLNLEQMQGVKIPYSISTLEFCILVSRYRDHIKQFQERNKKKNG